jgi:hypothetical protein
MTTQNPQGRRGVTCDGVPVVVKSAFASSFSQDHLDDGRLPDQGGFEGGMRCLAQGPPGVNHVVGCDTSPLAGLVEHRECRTQIGRDTKGSESQIVSLLTERRDFSGQPTKLPEATAASILPMYMDRWVEDT